MTRLLQRQCDDRRRILVQAIVNKGAGAENRQNATGLPAGITHKFVRCLFNCPERPLGLGVSMQILSDQTVFYTHEHRIVMDEPLQFMALSVCLGSQWLCPGRPFFIYRLFCLFILHQYVKCGISTFR